MASYFLFFLFCFNLYSEIPWGKDSDLSFPSQKIYPTPIEHSDIFTRFGEAAIKFHQEVISPADGPRSHFIPSSSQYTLDAMKKYGFFRGYTMGCDRLMRENNDDWVYEKTTDPAGRSIKWDPVK